MGLSNVREILTPAFFALVFPGLTTASNIAINPVKVVFEADKKIAVITITNRSNAPVLFQTSFKHWNMVSGDNVYAETEDIVASPPIFTVPENSSQVVRLAMLTSIAETEQPYRMFLEQIPSVSDEGQLHGLKVAVNFSLPVFISPSEPQQEDIDWVVHHQSNHEFFVQATNNSNVHIPVSRIGLLDGTKKLISEQNKHQYLLPGNSLFWELDCPGAEDSPEYIQAWFGLDTAIYTIEHAAD